MAMRLWRRAATATGVVVATLGGLLLAPALAAPPAQTAVPGQVVEVPLDTVVRDDPGSLTVLAEVAVPAELEGRFCDVESRARNNASVHPGNDLLVESDGAVVELLDVEASSGKVTTAQVGLTVGAAVRVTLRMGDDGVFSAGSMVVLDCPVPTTTTTTSSTTTSSTTTPPPTTTVIEPPGSTSSTTTSTTTPPPTTTVIEPPGSTSSTTSSTTTTVVEPPSSTSQPPPSTTVPGEPELPNTGPGTMLLLAGAGIVLLDLGYLTVSATRPARRRRR